MISWTFYIAGVIDFLHMNSFMLWHPILAPIVAYMDAIAKLADRAVHQSTAYLSWLQSLSAVNILGPCCPYRAIFSFPAVIPVVS